MEGMDLDLGLGLEQKPGKEKKTPPTATKQYHRGKIEYAPPFYTVSIQHSGIEGMPDHEVVGVNGEVIQIRLGEEVPNIPHAFVQVLKNAIAGKMFKRVDSEGKEHHEWRNVPAIPYSIVAGPYQERK